MERVGALQRDFECGGASLSFSSDSSDVIVRSEIVCNVMNRDIVSGLAHLHELGIMHWDLKTQNVIVEKEHPSMPCQSGCSSSKFPLHGHGALTKQPASPRQVTKRKEASRTSASASLETSSNKPLFSKFTVSPLRRFQLIDSDSDDPSVSEDANKETNKVESPMKEKQCNDGNPTTSQLKRTKASVYLKQRIFGKISIQRRVSTSPLLLWTSSVKIEEYFRSGKEKKGDFVPRIQKLVSSRLSYFFPPGAIHNSVNKHSFASVIDYRYCALQSLQLIYTILIPKDAGKRRVHAVGQSGGHWYTGPDGKRVYISNNGQELAGRIAYIHYRKESGAGFKRSKKKTAAKNTSQKKKPAAKRK
ncbi:uncharacterized protein LOC131321319 [Rhododendron vialii]|uniref:uncharacterized protein LOC131321319 n=1 Tax=Rhododendron vialii TaxID=182163 RepID=UPI00265DD3F2|nr:uncharacterized protein LOC131321319 [Rhododendron vialii]